MKEFKIITFTANPKRYYHDSIEENERLRREGYVKHSAIDMPLGCSRYGGPVFDMPKGLTPPEDLAFVAQLDLKEFSKYDQNNLLPETGQLIFFADMIEEEYKVIYSTVDNSQLERQVQVHDGDFWDGVLIDQIASDVETWDEDDLILDRDEIYAIGDKYEERSGISKIFGVFTNLETSDEEVNQKIENDELVLLQVGESGFNDEGVLTVTIPKEDLIKRNFDRCVFYYG
ncbi:DUF1963 domain-containing protein [Rapidithrix thailandica]|uniref:DUF1963 domain-containing protein n=1 Tax=Rapidithrix thailandica TaxID=413964 RepID=A0AAW9SD86_9BACT